MTVKEELERMWTEVILAYFKVLLHRLLRTMKKIKKDLTALYPRRWYSS
jgi:hypothetical protein